MLSKNNDSYELSILTFEKSDINGQKGIISNLGHDVLAKNMVNADIVSKNINEFSANLMKILDNIDSNISNYELSEYEIYIDISANGEISLVGSVGAGVTSGIKLIFKKK